MAMLQSPAHQAEVRHLVHALAFAWLCFFYPRVALA